MLEDQESASRCPRSSWHPPTQTLRAAELAGIASEDVLHRAVGEGSLTEAESVAAVLDHRARQIIPRTLPLGGGWAARAPRLPEPGTDQLGRAMDERTVRLGEHAAQTLPLWAERNLGSVPGEPVERVDWQLRAGAIAFYRDMTGYCSQGDPIGPAPATTAAEARAAWHTALVALAKVDGIDLSEMTPAQLRVRRDAYERETPWRPSIPAANCGCRSRLATRPPKRRPQPARGNHRRGR